MAGFITQPIPNHSFLSYVTLARWDNTAGPSAKCVWIPKGVPADAPNIKLLTRLILKTEVSRSPKSQDIDCNIYTLPELSACVVSYLFGAICNSKLVCTVYSLTFVYRLEFRATYLQWSDIIDRYVKQDLSKYRVLLHKVG